MKVYTIDASSSIIRNGKPSESCSLDAGVAAPVAPQGVLLPYSCGPHNIPSLSFGAVEQCESLSDGCCTHSAVLRLHDTPDLHCSQVGVQALSYVCDLHRISL